MVNPEKLARALFPYESTRHGADGSDCKAEVGNEGNPCRFCKEARREWLETVERVRLALVSATE